MISKRAYMYCCEDLSLIENYDKAINDSNQIWRCHHRLEIQDEGKIIYTPQQLESLGLYYNRPASELIFLTLSEHNTLHARYVPEERNRKRSETLKGRIPSSEHRKHLSEALKGRKQTEEQRKINSDCHKGIKHKEETKEKLSENSKRYWSNEINRRKQSVRLKGKKRTNEQKKHYSESAKISHSSKEYKENMRNIMINSENYKIAMANRKGEKCWNNGIKNIRAKECPEGFIPGRIKKIKYCYRN